MPFVLGASVIGSSHSALGLPCQDACVFEIQASRYCIAVVCDGLGSAPRSDLGAKTAVEAALGAVKTRLAAAEQEGQQGLQGQQGQEKSDAGVGLPVPDLPAVSAIPCVPASGSLPPELLAEVVAEAAATARAALEDLAVREDCPLHDLACTILVLVATAQEIATAHVGDGAVVALTGDGLEIASAPGESEYCNEVVPLTSPDWREALRVGARSADVRSVAVFTDGCQRVALRKSAAGYEPHDGFLAPVFSYAAEIADLAEGTAEIGNLLASAKLAAVSEDDKSLVIGILGPLDPPPS